MVREQLLLYFCGEKSFVPGAPCEASELVHFRKRIGEQGIIKKCHRIAEREEIILRQSYRRVLKKLSVDQRFRNHPKTKKKALRAERKVKVIAGRLVRELERKLPVGCYQEQLSLFSKVLGQTKNSTKKIYSLHEPVVQCISKGKEHKKYEFGNKGSVVYSRSGVIVGAMTFRNEYDGHALEPALQQVEMLTGWSPKTATADRGYRGKHR